MIINKRENMEERLKDEHLYLSKKYPNVAFNIKNWHGVINTGKEYLYATESYVTIPKNYDLNEIGKFKGFLTPNSKFYNMYNGIYNIILTNGPLNSHNYYSLDKFKSYDERIKGICALNRIYKPATQEGSIIHMRDSSIKELPILIKHTYGPAPWGVNYQGYCKEATHPNHCGNLEIINRYLFVLTLEPMYHELWSWDWVTERMWNAFKAKTVPIYFGCYNIEQKIPKELFIDFRDFENLSALANYIINFEKEKWVDMTEKAFEWYKTCKISNMDDLESLLSSLP